MEYLALGLAAFLGGVVCGFAGFAYSAVAGAILLHALEPLLAIPLMMSCSILSQVTSLAVLRRLVVWREIVPMMIGGAAGVPIAMYLLTLVEARAFRAAFGTFLVSYALYMLARPAAKAVVAACYPVAHSAVGFAGGFLGGLTAMPGAVPVIWCDLRGVPKERQRALVQPFILGMQVLALVTLACIPGAIHRDLAMDVMLSLPPLAVGTCAGIMLFGRVDEARFRQSVLLLLLVSGALMIM
jgi:uncharacterized membrane protein YfcA